MRSLNVLLTFLLFSASILVACSSISSPSINSTPPLLPMDLMTNAPNPQKTPTPIATNTLTSKPTEFPFLTPTIPPETLAALSTMDALVIKRPELSEFYSWNCTISPCYVSGLGLSPDGNWAVFFSAKESGGLSLVSVDGKKKWSIYFSDITDWTCPCGDARVQIERWSKDGKYLYVTPIDGSSGGYEWLWNSKSVLIRMNLDNGTWVDTKLGSSFSFSPSERFIAYRFGQDLVIREFSTGNERKFTIPTEYKAFGRFTWSSDNKKIIFIASINNLEQEEPPDGFTLYLLNLDDMSIKAVLEKDDRYLYPLEWLKTNTVLLESLFEVQQNGKLQFSGQNYQLNLETNEISVKEQ